MEDKQEKAEKELFALYKKTKDPEIKKEITMQYLYIARTTATKLYDLYSTTMQMEDAVNEGVVAIIKGIDMYDPDKNIKFSTYITTRVRGAMLDYVRKQEWMPRGFYKQLGIIESACEDMKRELGRTPTVDELAKHLGIIYLDTGAMYRGVAFLAQRHHVPAEEGEKLDSLLGGLSLNFHMIDEKKCLFDIEEAIRKPEISKIVSEYAKLPSVRMAMTRQQQRIAAETSVVMDGRDIGTVVLPNADYKFFITASVEERARRRYLELEAKGIHQDYQELVADITRRDRLDSTRDIAPLKQANDAILVDTDVLDANQVLEKIIEIISK